MLSFSFIVTNTNDFGLGSLRQAMAAADLAPGPSEISFNIPLDQASNGAFTIQPASPLPTLNDAHGGIKIDGGTQTAFTGDTNPLGPEIVLDGAAAGTTANGLVLTSNDNLISGLDIRNFAGSAVVITGSGAYDNFVAGNYLGTDATGLNAMANGWYGVDLAGGAHDNFIGGASPTARNVISGNGVFGVLLSGAGVSSNRVQGNYIGVDSTGAAGLGNGWDGVSISYQASGNWIGTDGDGTADDREGNVISANHNQNISLYIASDNVIAGNCIGTDATGTKALGVRYNGVWIGGGSQSNIIGTNSDGVSDAAERNVISGNAIYGIAMYDANTSHNVVAGNYIGTDVTGSFAIANGGDGVFCSASSNLFGGSSPAARNLISGNTGNGIFFYGANGNVVAGNYIGVDRTGTSALPNGNSGIWITGAASGNLIGTNGDGVADAAERNIISGNLHDGVTISNSGANGNTVAGNYIGTDGTGTLKIGNAWSGVSIVYGAQSNRIGSDGSDDSFNTDEANLISGNHYGIYIYGMGSSNNVIAGNYVGTNAAGTAAVPNGAAGVIIFGGAANNRVGTNGDGIGDAAERNVISGNGGNGVLISDSDTSGNVIAGNYIGVDATASKPLANGVSGVFIYAAAGNRIGTDGNGIADAAERNIISANLRDGVTITNSGANANAVAGNYIGTDVSGTFAIGNAASGVAILFGAQSNSVGSDGSNDSFNADEANLISGNHYGIYIYGAGSSNNVVAGNHVGTDAAGTAALPNGAAGVIIFGGADNNRIGTNGDGVADAAERNIISGNGGNGVLISDSGTSGNVIAGNYIGVDVTASKPLANGVSGVFIYAAAGNRIGTDGNGIADAAERNVISGNLRDGVTITNSDGNGNTVAGNYIGADATGTAALPNGVNGISIDAASNNTIGGMTAGAGNVISGNAADGIWVGSASNNNTVLGNDIGVGAVGQAALGNLQNGVSLNGLNNSVGGTAAGEGNTIAFNGGTGVLVAGAAVGNALRGNSIEANGGLGINLAGGAEDAYGVTANDPLDADSGPNSQQNYPVLKFARAGAKTLVSGAFNSAPNETFVLDFYAGNAVDPSGYGEAQRWLGAITVTTDDNGNAAFSSLLDGSTGPGDYVSATATDAAGNTSEFSLTLTLDHTAPTSTANPLPLRATSLSFPVSVTGSDPDMTGQVTSGVRTYDLYVSADGGPFTYWTTVPAGSPSAVFTAQSSHLYAFRSVASDNAGNVETKAVAVEASIYVPDLDPPVSHIDSVDSSSPRFKVSFSATEIGGSGLGTIGVFVEIDGAAPQQIATVNAAGSSSYSGSVQYQALEDGAAHNYLFYTVAADRNNNVEAAPAAPSDVELDNVLYSLPSTLQVTGFIVEQGAAERSFIRYLEIDFNRNVGNELQTIVATLNDGNPADDRLSLTRYDLSGENPVDATSALAGASIEVVGQAILIDFGPNGIGGNRNSNVGDGYYTLAFDLDNSLTQGLEATDSFYRLFGDTNGDRTVNLTDLANIAAAFGQTGIDLNADINGDGVVNILDRLYASHELGRTLDGNLPLDD